MDIEQVVREVTVRGSVQGMDQVARGYDQVSASADRTATVTEKTTKAQISAEAAVEKLRLRYQDNYRQQQQLADAQQVYQRAVEQGRLTQQAAAAELSNIQSKLGQATSSQKAMSLATQSLNLQIASLASGLGVTGAVLSSFGPWGFAAAVGIGAVQSALSLASDKAHELAQKSKEVVEFSEATGLTTRQFQALRSEAGKFGVDADTLASGLSKFTAGFEGLRLGEGALLENIRRINPALADQMQRTTDVAAGFTLFGKAVSEADNIFQRNALLKAGLGKGSAIFGAFLEAAPDVARLTQAFDDAGKGIDKNLIGKLRQLQIDIDRTKSAANNTFAGLFGTATLESELEFQKGLLVIANYLKELKVSADWKAFIESLSNPVLIRVLQGAAGGAAVGGGIGLFAGGVGAIPGAVGGAALGAAAGFLGGATESVVRDVGRAANDNVAQRSALPPAPNFDATFGSNFSPSVVNAAKTLEATAAAAKGLVSVLGGAASPSERLVASMADLEVKAKQAGLSTELLARAQAGLNLDAAIERQNAHNSALGASAPIADLVYAKTLQLQKLQQQGAGLTPAQIAFQKQLTAAQALGTYQLDTQINAEQLRIAVLGMSNEAGIAYAIVQERINRAKQNGEPLDAADIAALRVKAEAYAKIKTAADNYAEVLNTVMSQGTSTLTTGLTDIADRTKTISQGFSDMSKAVARAITEMIIKLYVVIPLMNALKGFGTTMFGGSSASASSIGTNAGVAAPNLASLSAKGNIFANDNIVPFAMGAAFTNSIVDTPTLFQYGEQFGKMGEAGPEAIVPLHRGSDGRLGVATAGAGGSPQFNVYVQNAPSQPSVRSKPNVSGGRDIMIDFRDMMRGIVADDAANDGPMSKAFAARAAGYGGS